MSMTTITYTFAIDGRQDRIDVSYRTSLDTLFDPAFDPKAPAVELLHQRIDIPPDAHVRIVKASQMDDR